MAPIIPKVDVNNKSKIIEESKKAGIAIVGYKE